MKKQDSSVPVPFLDDSNSNQPDKVGFAQLYNRAVGIEKISEMRAIETRPAHKEMLENAEAEARCI